MIVVVFRC